MNDNLYTRTIQNQEDGLDNYELHSILSLIGLKANDYQLHAIISACNSKLHAPRVDYTLSNTGSMFN